MQEFRGSTYLLAALTGAAWITSLLWRPAPTPRYTGLTEVRKRLPEAIAGYTFRGENPVSETVRGALAAADIESRTYADNLGRVADFTLIGGTDRSALHDPRSCLIGAGWRIENDHTIILPGTNGQSGPVARACRIVGGPKGESMEVVYLYVVSGQVINQVTQIRSQMLLSALVGRKNTPVCFVRFLHPLKPAATTNTAEQSAENQADELQEQSQFFQFAGQMWERLQIPKLQQTTVEERSDDGKTALSTPRPIAENLP